MIEKGNKTRRFQMMANKLAAHVRIRAARAAILAGAESHNLESRTYQK